MQYSLRSLMILVTLIAVVLGGRIEYLRRWAVYHESEAERIAAQYMTALGWSRQEFDEMASHRPPIQETGMWIALNHRRLGKEYRAAMIRPWYIVAEGDSP